MADLVHAKVCWHRGVVELKTPRIRGEKDLASRRDKLRDGAKELGVIAIYRKRVALHALRIGECRRIAHDNVVELAITRTFLKPLQTIGVKDLVISINRETIVPEIARVPLEVGLRHIDGHGLGRAASNRVHAERACVRKQIEHALSRRAALH